MSSKSVSVIGPLVPSPTITSPPSWPSSFKVWRMDSPSDHCRLTAAFTLMPGMDASSGSW